MILRRTSDCGNVNSGGEEISWIVRGSISSCQIIELLNSDGDGPGMIVTSCSRSE